jgi:hypothetical protein
VYLFVVAKIGVTRIRVYRATTLVPRLRALLPHPPFSLPQRTLRHVRGHQTRHTSSRSHARSIHALLATERAPCRPSLPTLAARQPNKDRKHGLAPQASGPPIVVAPTQHSASANHGPSVTDPLPNPTRMVFRASARSWRSSCKSRLGWEECAC